MMYGSNEVSLNYRGMEVTRIGETSARKPIRLRQVIANPDPETDWFNDFKEVVEQRTDLHE